MKVAIGCDHGGYDMKQIVIEYLEEKGNNLLNRICIIREWLTV